MTPSQALAALRASTASLVDALGMHAWSQAEIRGPSLLPGWTRGHVLTHLARNADSITRTIGGALQGQVVPRYPGGRAGRDADIEAGSARDYAALRSDVTDSARRLDRQFAAVAAVGGWHLLTEVHTTEHLLTVRWREVEIHRVDLDAGYRPSDWSAEFIEYLLPELMTGAAERVGTTLRVEIDENTSISPQLAGRHFDVPSTTAPDSAAAASPVLVAAPDWAVLAWLTGRPVELRDEQAALPAITSWI